jgi:hypothetical protein
VQVSHRAGLEGRVGKRQKSTAVSTAQIEAFLARMNRGSDDVSAAVQQKTPSFCSRVACTPSAHLTMPGWMILARPSPGSEHVGDTTFMCFKWSATATREALAAWTAAVSR